MKYRTIVADPPWDYPEGFAERCGKQRHKQDVKRGIISTAIRNRPLPYPSLALNEIEELPIAALAANDARLFLWATNRFLPSALRIMRTWGFQYKQILVWDKRPNVNPLGGSIAPNSAEFFLVANRGNPPRSGRWSESVISARKARSRHSEKPEVFLDLVEQVSPGPYLELFARRNRLGWDTWGNEVLEMVQL